MNDLTFLEKVKLMPLITSREVKDFIDFGWENKMGLQPGIDKNGRVAGLLEGKLWMSTDCDETPDDFKD